MKLVENKARVIAAPRGEFQFALEHDPETVYTIPLIQDLPAKQVRLLSKSKGDEQVDTIFDLFDVLAPGLTDVATQRDLALIMEAWGEASDISVGE